MTAMRVAFFGAYDPGYPRNRILRAGLAAVGVQVIEARVRERRAAFRWPLLAARFTAVARAADVVLVPEFRHKDVPLARALCGGRLLAFDPLVSRWDTLVHDWGLHAAGSAQARWNRGIDARALKAADVVLCDTWEHGALYESLGADRAQLRRVLVGAERVFFEVPEPPRAGPVRIVYVGGFLPLHGVQHVIAAAAELERMGGAVPEWEMELVGSGIEFEAVRARLVQLELERVRLTGPRPYAEAPDIYGRAHIVLGAFGETDKAGRVIPHKVYQGVAAGRAVVTGDSPAIREVFTPRIHLWTVACGDSTALAAALALLARDGAARERLARRGRERALEVATPERIGGELARILEEFNAAR